MRLLGETLGVEIQVFGPDDFITACVPLALGVKKSASLAPPSGISNANPTPAPSRSASPAPGCQSMQEPAVGPSRGNGRHEEIVSFEEGQANGVTERPWYRPFDETTRSLVYGLQPRAIQGMLDFDYACGRQTPSVAAMIYPFGGNSMQKCMSCRIISFAHIQSILDLQSTGEPKKLSCRSSPPSLRQSRSAPKLMPSSTSLLLVQSTLRP